VDSNTLRQFRHDLYDCFPRGKDALFNTVDALMTETQAKSFRRACRNRSGLNGNGRACRRHLKMGVLMRSPCEKSLPTTCQNPIQENGSG
jgi:hypothetical protein